MEEAERLRQLAAQCRDMAASLHSRPTAETLLEMAHAFEASACDSEARAPEPAAAAAGQAAEAGT
ncbi:MAG TPA: hypothetical protein VGX37_09855 [Allosphingosinicella sp.]|jgi:hypothetical protein|nr:hypothetical protein [Allosphingosinicella sp.]